MPPPEFASDSVEAPSRPLSPYSTTRSLIRDLTLPPVPNFDIPPSPPGSPPPGTTAKFAHFLELKKRDVHFNEKLARSSALKNPSLMQKLMGFAGIDEKAQYASTLPKDIWDAAAFPEWAYKVELAKMQQEVLKTKEEQKAKEQRSALEFVPASGSGESSRGGTPGASGVRSGKSAAERVMAGLDRERTRSPLVSESGRKPDSGQRSSRDDREKRRDRSRSRQRDRRRRSASRSRSRSPPPRWRKNEYDRRR